MFIWEVKGSSISKRPEVGLREVKWLEADFMADWREEEIEIAEEEDKRRRRRRRGHGRHGQLSIFVLLFHNFLYFFVISSRPKVS